MKKMRETVSCYYSYYALAVSPTARAALAVAVDAVRAALTVSTAKARACSHCVLIFTPTARAISDQKKNIHTNLESTLKHVFWCFFRPCVSVKVITL